MRRKQGPSKGKTKRRITLIGLVAVLLCVSVMFLVMEHSAVHANDNHQDPSALPPQNQEKPRNPIPKREPGFQPIPVQLDNPQNLFGPETAPIPAVVVAEAPVVVVAEAPVVKQPEQQQHVLNAVEKEVVEYFPDEEYLFPVPPNVDPNQLWRYSSKDLHWKKKDALFRKFEHYNQTLELPPPSVKHEIDRVCSVLMSKGREKLCRLFANCYPNTLSTTTSMLHDGTTYVITGDIPLMWLRDSSAQVFQYIPLLGKDPYIEVIFEGLIRRQIQWIKLDPYGSSYRLKLDFENHGKTELTDWDIKTGRTIHVAMHDYEVDSLCSFLKLSYVYYKATGESRIFENEWLETAKRIVDLWILEQEHDKSSYTYPILSHGGKGTPVCYTGMTWSGFRPSDDPCKYGYLIPSNMYAVVTLGYLEEVLRDHYPKETLFFKTVQNLKSQIDEGIHKFGLMKIGEDTVYAYEVDGCGNQYFMDDANVPSLLSIDYLGYKSSRDPSGRIARNTRKHILSEKNPFFFRGTAASGIGSPHTSNSHIWPMSLIMQAYTSDNYEEINQLLNWLEETDNDTGFMHESFHSQNPARFTREWFSWANSLFAELVLKHLDKVQADQ